MKFFTAILVLMSLSAHAFVCETSDGKFKIEAVLSEDGQMIKQMTYSKLGNVYQEFTNRKLHIKERKKLLSRQAYQSIEVEFNQLFFYLELERPINKAGVPSPTATGIFLLRNHPLSFDREITCEFAD
jgi:hypothetical protein